MNKETTKLTSKGENPENWLLDIPFEELNPEEIKQGIRQKFGRISRFAMIAKHDSNKVNNWLHAPKVGQNIARLRLLYNDARRFSNITVQGELTENQRHMLRMGIFRKSKNIRQFCEEHGYIGSWLSKVLNEGGTIKITTKIKELADFLKVKL